MRRIYRGLAARRAFLVKRAKVAVAEINQQYIIVGVGFGTFFFGFAAGAILNLYLLAINHPLVYQFRSALTYKSAIFGDGILLPIVNMIAVSFIMKHWGFVGKRMLQSAALLGILITAYFHINQAVQGIVNWAMPQPWQWNILGFWHAIYMFAVASLLSLFVIIVINFIKEEKEVPKEAVWVTLGVIMFFILLRLDYLSLNLSSFLPRF